MSSPASDRDDLRVRSEISQLQSLYCDLVDSRRPERIARLFAEDGMLQSASGATCIGCPAIVAYFEEVFGVDGIETKHLVSNFVFEEGRGPDEVGMSSGFVFLWSDTSVVRIGAGRYRDVVVRDGQQGRWVFKSKAISLDIPLQILS